MNGSRWVGSTLLHAVAKFRCDPGFRLAGGDSLRVCRGDGRWSGSLLSCQGQPYSRYYTECCVPGISSLVIDVFTCVLIIIHVHS